MELIPFRIPLRVRFRGVDERIGVLVKGAAGWGEFSPFPDYSDEQVVPWCRSALEAAEMGWPETVRDSIPVNATIPAVNAERAFDMIKAAGCTTAKVKVADGDDVARVAAVRDALGPGGRIRVDANGAWTVDEAERAIGDLAVFDLEYVEQPVATLAEMAELRTRVDVPLAADESVRNSSDPLKIAGLEAADIVVLKVQPLGGVRRALDVARACGLPVVVSSAVETSIGLRAGLALAAALPELPYACGLGTATLLDGDAVASPLVPTNGTIDLSPVEVDTDAIDPYVLNGADADAAIERFLKAVEAAELELT